MNGIRHAIAVASGKGGVGKSTVAVNLALALAHSGSRVGLLDADVGGPSIPVMVGMLGHRPRSADGERVEPIQCHGIKVMSMGFLVEATESLAFRGPVVHQVIQEFVRDVAWGDLDHLVVDLPPGTGDAVLTVVQNLPLTGVVIVTTPQNVAVASVVRCVALFRERDIPLLGVVKNMSVGSCPHCGRGLSIFGQGDKVRDLCDYWEIPFLGSIPLDPAVREAGDSGLPVVLAEPSSAAARSFRVVAGNLRRALAREAAVGRRQADAPPGAPGAPPAPPARSKMREEKEEEEHV